MNCYINRKLKKTIQLIEEYAKESYKLMNKYNTTKYMKITKDQEQIHDSLTVCKDCDCKFTEENKKGPSS